MEKLLNIHELEIARLTQSNNGQAEDLQLLKSKVKALEGVIHNEERYLDELFIKVSKDSITQKIDDYQKSKSI
jgi:hypothetical protein